MEFIFLGHSSFRIKTKAATIVTDPYDPQMVGLKFPKVDANIVTLSHDHADHNRADLVLGEPKLIKGPGEYEISGIPIIGVSTWHDNKNGQERGENTVYVLQAENLRVCHLGDLGHKLSEEQIQQIGNVHVLLIPVGGVYTIDAERAAEVVSQIEPLFILPMHYQTPGLNPETFGKLAPVDDFIRNIGVEPIKETRYSISSDRLPEEMQLVVLARKS